MTKTVPDSLIIKMWERSGGRAWEPKDITAPKSKEIFADLSERGFVKIVDGRCGFEKMKDSMVAWTDAGKRAVVAMLPAPTPVSGSDE